MCHEAQTESPVPKVASKVTSEWSLQQGRFPMSNVVLGNFLIYISMDK